MLGAYTVDTMSAYDILRHEGFSAKDVQDYLADHDMKISLSCLRNYLKASSVQYGRSDVWEGITSFMAEHDVPWNDEW